MKNSKAQSLIVAGLILFVCPGAVAGQGQKVFGPLSIAATGKNIEAIVTAVGGDQVDAFSLFKGCILRSDLNVKSDAAGRLAAADAVVWTGFLRESAAINASLNDRRTGSPIASEKPAWIDISKDTTRVNVPTSTCYGYLDAEFASGDPFFWLNPENGPAIAENIAEGLGNLRPEKRKYFLANAEAFTASLNSDIRRWKKQLADLADLHIFATLCGWQNFTRMGGPDIVVYKTTPGSLPDIEHLLEQLKRMEIDVVVIDPGISSRDREAFLKETGVKVLEIPSCIESIPRARTYSALFDNFIRVLLEYKANHSRS